MAPVSRLLLLASLGPVLGDNMALESSDLYTSRTYAPHSSCHTEYDHVSVVKQGVFKILLLFIFLFNFIFLYPVPTFSKHCTTVDETKCKTIFKNSFSTAMETQCTPTFDTSCDSTLNTAYKQDCKEL